MHLPDFILTVILSVTASAIAIAEYVNDLRTKRILFWIAGFAFWSLGVVWSATSDGYSLRAQLFVSGVIGAVAAAGLTFALWAVKGKAGQSSSTQTKQERTFLSAEDSEGINVDGIHSTGADHVFKLKRVKDFNATDVDSDQNQRDKLLPPPPPELAKLSNEDLKQRVDKFCKEIREFRDEFDRNRNAADATYSKAADSVRGLSHQQLRQILILAKNERDRETNSLDTSENEEFTRKYLSVAISLAAAVVGRIGAYQLPDGASSLVRQGADIISTGKPLGPQREEAVSQFLTAISLRLGH
jgi:hypothetical protein